MLMRSRNSSMAGSSARSAACLPHVDSTDLYMQRIVFSPNLEENESVISGVGPCDWSPQKMKVNVKKLWNRSDRQHGTFVT